MSRTNRLGELAMRAYAYGILPTMVDRPFSFAPLHPPPPPPTRVEFVLLHEDISKAIETVGMTTTCHITRVGPAAISATMAPPPNNPSAAVAPPPTTDNVHQPQTSGSVGASSSGTHTTANVGHWDVFPPGPSNSRWTGRLVDNLLGSRGADRKVMLETLQRYFHDLPQAVIHALSPLAYQRSSHIATQLNESSFGVLNVRDVVRCL